MTAYRKNMAKRGYNPFDYPEEWEFFKHPFEAEEEDDILTDLLFQVRKMTRRLHLFFDAVEYDRLETAFYFGLLDSLSEADDYLLGALKYARYCRLENLFFLTAHKELWPFLEKLGKLQNDLFSKIRSFGESTVELNKECHDGNLFLHQYCELTQHGIPNDMLHALLRAPGFPFGMDKTMKIDKNTNILSYLENATAELKVTVEERNIEGARDSSNLKKILEPVDWLLYYIRGTLLWVVIKKVMTVFLNATAIANRHDKLLETMYQDAYKEVCGAYARSKAYAKRRDEELPRQCVEEFFFQSHKPTDAEIQTYFNTQYRNLILTHNQSQKLYHQHRKQENTFYIEFLNMLLNEDTREDAEDFLFIQTFSKELSAKPTPSGKKCPSDAMMDGFANITRQTSEHALKVERLIVNEMIIEGGEHPHFPNCLTIEDSKNFYAILSQYRFIDVEKTPLADFNYLMGAATQYTTPGAPKRICWLKNRQMLRVMLKLAFAPLLENGTKLKYLSDFVPNCFVDQKDIPLSLAKNDERQIVKQELEVLTNFFATISRPEKSS